MTPNSIQAVIDGILAREGKVYTNRKDDRGGPTKFGITLNTLSKWRKVKVTPEDVEKLTEEEAREIYAAEYVTAPRFDMINDDGVASLLIDWGVMSGSDDAVKGLQKVLNNHGAELKVDGVLGSKTAGAANLFTGGNRGLRNALVDAKVAFHIDDTVKNPEQLANLKGWYNRTIAFRVD